MKSFGPNVLAFLTLSTAVALGGCSDPDEATLIVTVIDGNTNAPIPNALIGVETGGAYQPTPDPAKANTSWVHGAQADANGQAELVVAGGRYGFHTFAAGYFYGSAQTNVDSDPFEMTVKSIALDGEPLPTATGLTLDPAVVEPGGTFSVTVDVAAPGPADLLSEEIALTIPSMLMTVLMDPPSAGTPGVGYPDGTYTRTLTAPDTPGTYDIWLSVTTEHCVTSAPISVQLQVQ